MGPLIDKIERDAKHEIKVENNLYDISSQVLFADMNFAVPMNIDLSG